jgi:probable HAF family extracellular repeat protein
MRRNIWYLVGCAVLAGCDSTAEPAAPTSGATDAVGVTQAAVTDVSMKSAFTIRDLGTLGGGFAAAHDINRRGQIAGEADLAEPTTHAFLTDQGYRLQDLGSLGGGFSVALGVNDLGNVVGFSNLYPDDDVHVHGFVWTAETGIRDMGTLGGDFSVPRDINDRRQAVGFTGTAAGKERPFLWTQETGMQDLQTLGGAAAEGDANDINSATAVVGGVFPTGFGDPDGHGRAFLWRPGQGARDLGTLGGTDANAWAINDYGDITGWAAMPSGEARPFLWTQAEGMKDLGSLGGGFSEALNLNEHRTVVGLSVDTEGQIQAFVWTARLGLRQLPRGGLGIAAFAEGVNDLNQIVGTMFRDNGEVLAVVWTPTVNLDTAPLGTAPEALFAVRPNGAAVPSSKGWCRFGRMVAGRPVNLKRPRIDACPAP